MLWRWNRFPSAQAYERYRLARNEYIKISMEEERKSEEQLLNKDGGEAVISCVGMEREGRKIPVQETKHLRMSSHK